MQVQVRNLYYLLSYAWGHFAEDVLAEVSAETIRTAEQLFARVLIGACRKLLRQRLDRGYRQEVDDLRCPRGKLQVSRSLARATALRGVVECAYDEATEDVLHNRIIKATAQRLCNVDGLPPRYRGELLDIVREMSRVADVALSARDFLRIQRHSNLVRYRLALDVCELLHRCLLPDPRSGRWQFPSFVGNEREMGLLFEAFVREFLRREQRLFPFVKPTRIHWVAEGDSHELLPELRTDITLRRPGHSVVLEAKCYGAPLSTRRSGKSGALRSQDVCQLMAYLTNFRPLGDTLTGVLLYAVDRNIVPATKLRILDYDVHVLELNLNEPWDVMDRRLRELVATLAGPPSAS